MPTAPMRCGSALQELHCPVPLGSVAVHGKSSALYGSDRFLGRTPHPPAGGPAHCTSSTAPRQ